MYLSIIIPVFNVERYIYGTLNSIYSQGIDERLFEVIVVDDGTPDNSMRIVGEFALRCGNLTIIHQTNQGLSSSRNAGLDAAKGDYIWFVDSDDQLTENAMSTVLRSINETPADIIGYDMVRAGESSGESSIEKIISRPKLYNMYNKSLDCFDILYKTRSTPCQRFIFKHEFLRENELRFCSGIIHEDEEFMARALFLAKSIVYKDFAPYQYLVRSSGSIMATQNMNSVYSHRAIIDLLIEFADHNCANFRQRAYMIAKQVEFAFRMLKKNSDTLEYVNYVREQTPMLRKLACKGIIANIYFGSVRKIILSLILLISPLWYNILWIQKRMFS